MKALLLSIFTCVLASAASLSPWVSNVLPKKCTGPTPCTSYSLAIAQFDPSLGVLQSVDYTFTDRQSVLWGYNEMYVPSGLAISGKLTSATVASDLLPINIQASTAEDFHTPGTDYVSFMVVDSQRVLSMSGTADTSAFIGDSFLPIVFTSTAGLDGMNYPGRFLADILGIKDQVQLSVTYNYTPASPLLSPVPEPRYTWMLLGILAALLVCSGFRRGYRTL